jgi:phosphonopyruvate decarboxylase|tara:strand:- start:1228 stop:1716 length:489 start_codon:yes stop_codon:yes gene_type:complete
LNYKSFCNLLKESGFDFFTGVPCSILGKSILFLSRNKEFQYIPATTEGEAIGLASGAYMAGRRPVVLMQNSGLGVSINALTSLVLLYKIPLFLVITWRGYGGNDAPEHLLMGKWMLDFLKVMNIPVMILSKDSNKNQIVNFAKKQKNQGITTALILKKGVIE